MEPGALDPPEGMARKEAGNRVAAAATLLYQRINEYRRATLAEAGEVNADERVRLNVRAVMRKANLEMLLDKSDAAT